MQNSKEWRQGRIGEILQIGLYTQLGVELSDFADRTYKRAPMLLGREGKIVSPDANAVKTAKFFLEFKTKSHHFEWRGGSKNDEPKISARKEQGIEADSLPHYQDAERRWQQSVVLSIMSILEGEIIAAPLQQLREPRYSSHPIWPLVNWDVRNFSRIVTFDADRLHHFFNTKDARFVEALNRWLTIMPSLGEIWRVLKWLDVRQLEFDVVKQHIFDQIECGWK